MATNPLIPLMAEVPNTDRFINSFLTGRNVRLQNEDRARAKELQPMEDAERQAKLDAARTNINTADISNEQAQLQARIKQAQMQNAHARSLAALPREQRREAHSKYEQMTGTGDDIVDPVEDDNYLSSIIDATNSLMNGQELTTKQQDALFASNGDMNAARDLVRTGMERSGVSVTVNDGGTGSFNDALAKADAGTFVEIQNQAASGAALKEQLDVARSMDVTTGAGESYALAGRELAKAFNIPVDVDKINDAQAFKGVMKSIVNDRLTQEKGNQTKEDVTRFEEQFATLESEGIAKDFLLGYASALQERKIEKGEYFDNWRLNNPNARDLTSARRGWRDYMAQTALISKKPSPATGLPMFFYDYERGMREANPKMSDEAIRKLWQQINM